MAENKSIWGKRVLAGLGALALTSAGLLGGSTAAFADSELGNIDFTQEGSLTIHKHEHQTGTGTKAPDGSGTADLNAPVKGVTFTAYPITGINLQESTDWDKLNNLKPGDGCSLKPEDVAAGLGLGAEIEFDETDEDGIASKTLDLGAYLVCETGAPDTVVDSALPFIVTIPMPFENNWVYGVHVYPKNGVTGIEKEISSQEGHLGLGSLVKFPVKTTVPTVDKVTGEFSSYVISDDLDPRLTPAGIAGIKIVGGADVPAGYYNLDSSTGQNIVVTFTDEGLTWLKSQGNKTIETIFQGTVNEVGTGVINNDAVVYVNGKEVTSNEVTTYWGDVQALKIDSSDPSKVLNGAEFEVYEAAVRYPAADATCGTGIENGASPLSVKGATTFPSKDGGVVSIDGLFVGDSFNAPTNPEFRCYVLKEIKAPAGYVLPTGGAEFTAVAVKTGLTNVELNGYDATIKNSQQEVPELPLTGANGQMVMIIGGSALLLIAGGVVMLNRRRTSETKNNQ